MPGFSLQARKGLWDLTQPGVGVWEGSQWAHGATLAVPTRPPSPGYPSSSATAQPRAAIGQSSWELHLTEFCCDGESVQSGNQNVYQNPPLGHTKTDTAVTALNS